MVCCHVDQQPAVLSNLAQRYAAFARTFIGQSAARSRPFFLYVPFSHVHQLCAPTRGQWASSAFVNASGVGPFGDAVMEMDWITGEVMDEIATRQLIPTTLVLWTSDDGPWTAEQQMAGSVGPFHARWFAEHAPAACYACPAEFAHKPTASRPARCVCAATPWSAARELDGIPCGLDVGLGSTWEANLRMPAIARWQGRISPGSSSLELVSTLDVLPTLLSLVGVEPPRRVLDGVDISHILLESPPTGATANRSLFFWRDRAPHLTRPSLFAVKIGRYKAHLWTKSATGPDIAVRRDPPILFDTIADEAEAYPLDAAKHAELVARVRHAAAHHEASIDPGKDNTRKIGLYYV
jgi:arylsulfatase A-like enzyme